MLAILWLLKQPVEQHAAGAGARVAAVEPERELVEVVGQVDVAGASLTADPGTWSAGMVPAFQWLRSGRELPGATSNVYTPTSADEGAQLTVRVTMEQLGWAAVVRASGKTSKVMKPGTPTISGTVAVGSTAKALVGSWTARTGFSYRWLRNGVPMKGATGSRYTVTAIDGGGELSVRVTGKRKGYPTATATSDAIPVPAV